MEILTIKTDYIVLVNYNEIPLSKLMTQRNAEKLMLPFGFAKVDALLDELGQKTFGMRFQYGAFQDETTEVPVESLQIEERKMVITIEGTTNDAEKVYEKIRDILKNVAGKNQPHFLAPLLISHESVISSILNFSIDKIIAEPIFNHITMRLPTKISSEKVDVFISLNSVNFDFNYLTKDPSLLDSKITIVSKSLSISAIPGRPITEKTFLSKAPLDTDTHKELLETLERLLE